LKIKKILEYYQINNEINENYFIIFSYEKNEQNILFELIEI